MEIPDRYSVSNQPANEGYSWQRRLPICLLPAATLRERQRCANVAENKIVYETGLPGGLPCLPKNLVLREYQVLAIRNWLNNYGRGTLKMATGSGKTVISLAAATQLYQQIGLRVLLIICPLQHLVLQWDRECRKFNLDPILAFNNASLWQSDLSQAIYRLRFQTDSFITIVTTNDTFSSLPFQSQIPYLPPETLLVGDEVHNLGARHLSQCLPAQIGLRLALSATPERQFDNLGTDRIFSYFGDIIPPEFTLADAIAAGALVPYDYYPIPIELTPAEREKYLRLTQQVARCVQYYSGEIDARGSWVDRINSPEIRSLLIQRARLIGCAEQKIPALKQLMKNRLDTSHTLFYCGDSNATEKRQLDEIVKILGKELGYRVATYTARNTIPERELLRREFDRGELQGLVAIRCLDEGIDLPTVKTAVILASSSNPRQYIQRRGRILRSHPSKTKAELFDFIVSFPTTGSLDRELVEIDRTIVRRELNRAIEFAKTANNANDANRYLLKAIDAEK